MSIERDGLLAERDALLTEAAQLEEEKDEIERRLAETHALWRSAERQACRLAEDNARLRANIGRLRARRGDLREALEGHWREVDEALQEGTDRTALAARVRAYRHAVEHVLGVEADGVYVATDPEAWERHSLHGTGWEPSDPPRLARPVIVSTLPKSGTYVIHNALVRVLGASRVSRHLTELPPELEPLAYSGHIVRPAGRDDELAHAPTAVFVRDPRGYVTSYMRFIRNVANGEPIWREMNRRFPTDIELTRAIVDGYAAAGSDARLASLADSYAQFCFAWLDHGALCVRYEDLFLPGTKELDRDAFVRIADHLGLDRRHVDDMLAGAAPLNSMTFTPAAPDDWRQTLPADCRALVEQRAGAVIARLGYEPARAQPAG